MGAKRRGVGVSSQEHWERPGRCACGKHTSDFNCKKMLRSGDCAEMGQVRTEKDHWVGGVNPWDPQVLAPWGDLRDEVREAASFMGHKGLTNSLYITFDYMDNLYSTTTGK